MFLQLLRSQWLASRQVVFVFVVLAFAAPLATVYYGGSLTTAGASQVSGWLLGAEKIGSSIPVIALFLGVALGIATWAPDHLGQHVYALTLPLPRPMFVLLRFGAGAVLLLGPVAALGLGALVATLAVDLPTGVHAYPIQLTLRFALASLFCFGIFFALSIGTKRALLLLLGLIGGVFLADLLVQTFGGETHVTETVLYLLTNWPGPLSILLGRWALFDV